MKGGGELNLRKPISIEKSNKNQILKNTVIQHKVSYSQEPDMIRNKNNPLLESLTVDKIKGCFAAASKEYIPMDDI